MFGINILSGTKMRTGEAGAINQFGTNGGVTQFELPFPVPAAFDLSWFSNIQNL